MSSLQLDHSVDDDLEASPHLFTGGNNLFLGQNKAVSKTELNIEKTSVGGQFGFLQSCVPEEEVHF